MPEKTLFTLIAIAIVGLLILIHESGHFLMAKLLKVPVKEFALGFGKALWQRQWGETTLRLNVLPLGGYCAFLDDDKEAGYAEDDPRLLRNRAVWQRFLVVSGGVLFNFLAAYVALLIAAFTVGFTEVKVQDPRLHVTQVMADQPAAVAGFQAGDRLVSIDGQPVTDGDAFIKTVKEHADRVTSMVVARGDATLTLVVTPNAAGKIGVGIGPIAERVYVRPSNPVVGAWNQQVDLTVRSVEGLAQLVTGKVSLNEVGGPVEIVRAGSFVGQNDARNLLSFTALISIGLAIMNVLPLPALDGGHMVFLLIEGIFRRPVPRKIEEPIMQTGLILLLGLMSLLLIKDVVNPIKYPEMPPKPPAEAPLNK
jgi:membrane-associated protease RseP (regulator of RpoE activity)